MNKNTKIWTVMGLVLLSLILCIVGVLGSYTAYTTSSTTLDGSEGIVYVNSTSSLRFSTAVVFVEYYNATTLIDLSDVLINISNLTLWTDIDGTWANNQTNLSAIDNTTFSWTINGTEAGWEGTKHWNIKVSKLNNSQVWLFSTNKSFMMDYVQIRNKLVSPANNTIFITSTPEINLTVTGTESVYECCLVIAGNSRQCKSNILNNTLMTFRGSETDWGLTGGTYNSYFDCTKTGSNNVNETSNFTIKYTNGAPSVTVVTPTANVWKNSNQVDFNITPNGNLLTNCSLYGNFADGATWALNQTGTAINNTVLAFNTTYLLDNYTGYTWGYRCTNEASQITAVNYTVYVDTLYPDLISCTSPANDTRGTDYTPSLGWSATIDTTFLRYTLFLMNGSVGYIYSYNISSNSTIKYNITDNLSPDMQWYWNVSVVDKAGNTNTTDNCSATGRRYYPDSVGHTLLTGYNFFSIVRNTDAGVILNASTICNEPSVTPTSISRWNFTDNAWGTHVCGTATNNFRLYKADVVVMNMPSAGTWETGRVWDMTNSTKVDVTISNVSGVNWNLIGVTKDTTLTLIDKGNRNNTANMQVYNATNETSSTTIWSNVNYQLAKRYLAALIVYNNSGDLIPSTNYTVNLNSGLFRLSTLDASANFSGNNFTFDYTFIDIHMLNWMSYSNHSQVNIPFKTNWSLNGNTNLYDGDALWVNINDTQKTSLIIDRSLW